VCQEPSVTKSSPKDDCVFCAIVAGRHAAAVVFEDDLTMAFLDITVVTEGHTLVIPKPHAMDLWDISQQGAVAVMRTVHLMAQRIRDVLEPDGLTLFQANREAGWQDVFHLHVHLVPRTPDDPLSRPWMAGPKPLSTLRATRDRLATPVDRG
jgi:histidine triad (HIT) family protein